MFGHKKIFNKITYFCHPETGNMQIKNKVSTHCTNIFEATGKFMLCINTNFTWKFMVLCYFSEEVEQYEKTFIYMPKSSENTRYAVYANNFLFYFQYFAMKHTFYNFREI